MIRYLTFLSFIGLLCSCSEKNNSTGQKQTVVPDEENAVIPIEVISQSLFKIEEVPVVVASKIRDAITPLMQIKDYPNGFKRIEDVRFTWLNIAGMHTRCAVSEDLFLFPRLDIANEDHKWSSGIALRRNSNIAYRWEIDNIE